MRSLLGAYAQVNKKGPATVLVVGDVRTGEDKQMYAEFKLSNLNAGVIVTGFVHCHTGQGNSGLTGCETGKLVCANEINELAEAIRELLDNESSRKKLGSAARQRIIDKFTLQAELERNAALYRRLGRKTWHSHSKLIFY